MEKVGRKIWKLDFGKKFGELSWFRKGRWNEMPEIVMENCQASNIELR